MTHTISAETHQSAVDFNIFEGMTCQGGPEYVIVNGRVAVDEGQVKAVAGYGSFIPTPVFAPFVYDAVKAHEEGRQWTRANRDGKGGGLPIQYRAAAAGAEPSASIASAAAAVSYEHHQLPTNGQHPASPAHSVNGDKKTSSHMEHFTRGPTSAGGRNMQDTTFSLSSEYPNPADSSADGRSTIRVKAPPGGFSAGLW